MQTRRLIAVGVIVVIVLALALLVRGCESSATANALKTYNTNVYRLIGHSNANGQALLTVLGDGHLNANFGTYATAAQHQLADAEGLQTPSQMAPAQANLVSMMKLREQAVVTIATAAPKAANQNTSKDALGQIAAGASELFASDVLYKKVVAPDIASALHADSIPVGVMAGDQQINPGQVVPDLGWLQPTWIADKIGAKLSPALANINNMQPNLVHGDALESVTVDGTTLSPQGNNTIPATSARSWTLAVLDAGQSAEADVTCKVTIEGANDSATAMISTIAASQTLPCTVTLPRKPPAGPYTVTATVEKVPLEKNLQNNTYHYTVTFN